MGLPTPLNLEEPNILINPHTLSLSTTPRGLAIPEGEGLQLNAYVSGHATVSEGGMIQRFTSSDGPGADYFNPMGWVFGAFASFHWTDLGSFFWWVNWPGMHGEPAFIPPDYFPAAQRVVLTPSEVDAERIPDPEYEVDDD